MGAACQHAHPRPPDRFATARSPIRQSPRPPDLGMRAPTVGTPAELYDYKPAPPPVHPTPRRSCLCSTVRSGRRHRRAQPSISNWALSEHHSETDTEKPHSPGKAFPLVTSEPQCSHRRPTKGNRRLGDEDGVPLTLFPLPPWTHPPTEGASSQGFMPCGSASTTAKSGRHALSGGVGLTADTPPFPNWRSDDVRVILRRSSIRNRRLD